MQSRSLQMLARHNVRWVVSEGQTEDHMLIHGVSHGKSIQTGSSLYCGCLHVSYVPFHLHPRNKDSDRTFQRSRSPSRDRDRGNQRQFAPWPVPGHEFISIQSLTTGQPGCVPLRWVDGLGSSVPQDATPLHGSAATGPIKTTPAHGLADGYPSASQGGQAKWCLLRTAAAAEFKQGVPGGCDWLSRPTMKAPRETYSQLAGSGHPEHQH